MTIQSFEAFGFAEPLSRALVQCGYATPTPIQNAALPPQLDGRDLLGLAETGSGKTAAFVLPILQRLATVSDDPSPKQVLALILAPTRELALQIDQEVASLSRNLRIRHAVVLGGVGKASQIHALKRGVHVLVATPGRLLDHVGMRTCDLSHVNTLVIDEADRMFDMGFIRDIRKIVSLIPAKRRTALLSATMPTEIKKFAYEILSEPYRVDLSSKQVVVDRIEQKVMLVRTPDKQGRLHRLLEEAALERVIVFARTKRGADRVASRLGMAGVNAVAFHGNKAQNARQRALADFTAGHIRVLVATDIAARGIDVANVTHVINFDMPLDPETYVHRVGRTARKGRNGTAISLCDPSEKGQIAAIEKLIKVKIETLDDVGGDTPPLPERRPHRAHDTQPVKSSRSNGHGRRDGAHGRDTGPPKSGKVAAEAHRFHAKPDRRKDDARGPGGPTHSAAMDTDAAERHGRNGAEPHKRNGAQKWHRGGTPHSAAKGTDTVERHGRNGAEPHKRNGAEPHVLNGAQKWHRSGGPTQGATQGTETAERHGRNGAEPHKRSGAQKWHRPGGKRKPSHFSRNRPRQQQGA